MDRSPVVYRIAIAGHLDQEWSEWFDGLAITPLESGETVLTGPLADQAALHGVLMKIRDLGLPLLAVARIETEDAERRPDAPDA